MATESIGALVPTAIPGYADAADIQAALRAYHYGSYSYNPANTSTASLVNPSIAYTITDLQTQISAIVPGISPNTFNAKGDLLSASADNTPLILSSGTNGQYLKVNTATSTGLEWGSLPTASTSTAGIVQLSDSTASTSTSLAATANSVKTSYDLANAAIPKTLTTTTGDIIYASSANTPARLGIGSTDQVLTVVGGVPAYANGSKKTLTTTGDLLYASAANTLARLGIGSTGQVLTVAGGVPTWATSTGGGSASLPDIFLMMGA